MGAAETVEKLLAEPWAADDIVKALSVPAHKAVRTTLLARTRREPTAELLEVLGQFADGEVLAAIELAIEGDVDDDVIEGAAKGLAAMKLPAAKVALRGLVRTRVAAAARVAIEALDDKPAEIIELLLPLVDPFALRGDDLLMAAIVEKLVEVAPKDTTVIAALARHWAFGIEHRTTYFASNAIFDALIEHAPANKDAQAAFAAAVAHEDEYGKVRGHGALALTGDIGDAMEHVRALTRMKGLQPSGSALRKAALQELVRTRKPALEKLAKAGDKTAAKLLK